MTISDLTSREGGGVADHGRDYHASVSLGEVVQRLAIGDELFWEPERLVPFEHWVGHIPFAFWLTGALRPRMLVELGTHRGNSYCAFCQAIDRFRIDCKAFAVDTWLGDAHMAQEDGVLEDLRNHHDPRYGSFSSLMETTFADASRHFLPGTIDLLHHDGTHTYDAVRKDFEEWLPLLSERAVVLFHDINVRRDNFGVWKLWEELSGRYSTFGFLHSYGLGLIGVGTELPPKVRALLDLEHEPALASRARRLFAMRGEALMTKFKTSMLEQSLQSARTQLIAPERRASELEAALANERKGKLVLAAALFAAESEINRAARGPQQLDCRSFDSIAIGTTTKPKMWRSAGSILRSLTPWYPALAQLPTVARRYGRAVWQVLGRPPTEQRAIGSLRLRLRPLADATAAGPVRRFNSETVAQGPLIAVVVHLACANLWPQVEAYLDSVPETFDLFVSLAFEDCEAVESTIHGRFPTARIQRCVLQGDQPPFVAFINSGVLFRYELVCKICVDQQEISGESSINQILGDAQLVRRILNSFDASPDLGLVVPDGCIHGAQYNSIAECPEPALELGSRIGIASIPPDTLFPSGPNLWVRPFLLRILAASGLGPGNFMAEKKSRAEVPANVLEHLIGLICRDAGMTIAESGKLEATTRGTTSTAHVRLHLIAYYLPQFHPIPENDAWWGTGFTEWSNVTRAQPVFKNHRQPRLPADLGFYDLRLSEVREAQAELARHYGLSAFCYYYYWFNGKRLLHHPLDEVLASGSPDFPFMICWANEPWTRGWDGSDEEILMPQSYGPNWPARFASDVAPLLRDRRYFRLGGRPAILIYRVMHIPDRVAAFGKMRDAFRYEGIGEIYLAGGWVSSFPNDEPQPREPSEVGLDGYFEFPPHHIRAANITNVVPDLAPDFCGNIYSYDSAVASALAGLVNSHSLAIHHGLMMGWDSTARRRHRADVFHGATPAKFRRWLRGVVEHELRNSGDVDRMILINAWNEWAEGTYLEPDRDFGRGWLEAVASCRKLAYCTLDGSNLGS